MAFPTATPAPTPAPPQVTEPVKRNFTDYDSLISELNVKKENILPTPPPGSPASMQVQPGGLNSYAQPTESFAEPISPEAAARSGARIAKTFDKVFAFTAAMYAKNDNQALYSAKPGEIEDLSAAWSDVAMKYSFKIEDSPWFNVILLMVAIYAPVVMRARTDHRFAVMEQQLEEQRIRQEAENQAIRDRIEKIEAERNKDAA